MGVSGPLRGSPMVARRSAPDPLGGSGPFLVTLLLTICASLLAALGAFLLAKREAPDSSARRWNTVIFLSSLIAALAAFVESRDQAAFEQELRERTDRIVANITGGESFCYVNASNAFAPRYIGVLFAMHEGSEPLYDVSIKVLDLDAFDSLKPMGSSLLRFRQSELRFDPGTLIPQHAEMLNEAFSLGDGNSRRFFVTVVSRNGSTYQDLRFKRVGTEWQSAIRVSRDEKVIFEKVYDKFPRDANGEVDWK